MQGQCDCGRKSQEENPPCPTRPSSPPHIALISSAMLPRRLLLSSMPLTEALLFPAGRAMVSHKEIG